MITLAGQTDANDYGTSITIPYVSTSGNTLVLYCQSLGELDVSDTANNTWQFVSDTAAIGAASQREGQLFYCVDAASVSSVTLSRTENTNYNVKLTEWTGIEQFVASGTGNTNTQAAVMADENDLVISAAFAYSSSSTPKATPASYTGLDPAIRSAFVVSSAYKTVATTGSTEPVWSGTFSSINAVFRGAVQLNINAGADQTVTSYDTVALQATTSGSSSLISWQQTAGSPMVSLSGSGSTSSFVAPAIRAGTSLTFAASISENAQSAADSTVITIAPHNEWAVIGGSQVAINTNGFV